MASLKAFSLLLIYILLSAATLTSAKLPFNTAIARAPISNNPANLFIRQPTNTTGDCEVPCGHGGCMPSDATCCNETLHTYCRAGLTCVVDGCCPDKQTCETGPPTNCVDDGAVLCGNLCVPPGSQCCDPMTGHFCRINQTCGRGGRCYDHGHFTVTAQPSSTSSEIISATPTSTSTPSDNDDDDPGSALRTMARDGDEENGSRRLKEPPSLSKDRVVAWLADLWARYIIVCLFLDQIIAILLVD